MRLVLPLVLLVPATLLASETVTIGGSVVTSEIIQGWSNFTLPESKKLPAILSKGLTLGVQYLGVKHEDGHATERHHIGSIQLGKRVTLWHEKLAVTGSAGIATDGENSGFAGSSLVELRPSSTWGMESHLTFAKIGHYNLAISEPVVELYRKVKGPVYFFSGVDIDHLFARTTLGINPGIMVSKWKFHIGAGPIWEKHFGEAGGHEFHATEHSAKGWKTGAKMFANFHFGGGH